MMENAKSKLEAKNSVPIDRKRIIFAGRQLASGRTLSDNTIEHGSTLHLILRLTTLHLILFL